ADRLEELLAVLLHQRLEERQAKDLALALVDAWGQQLVDVVAEDVAVQERAAAVRLHEQLDGRFLLRLAPKDLGNNTLQLAAVALVDQPAPPCYQSVAGDDEAGKARDAALDQLARVDRGAVSAAEVGPR